MAKEHAPNGRQRWTQERRKKEPTLYDEWLNEERAEQQHAQSPQRVSSPLRPGDTAGSLRGSGSTIRTVTPDTDASLSQDESAIVPERGTTSFERVFIPRTTTTIIGGPAARAAPNSPVIPKEKSRRLIREREWERETRTAAQISPPSSRNGTRPADDMLARSGSRSNRQHALAMGVPREASQSSVRPRTRTLDEFRPRQRSPTALLRSQNRIGSVHTPSSPIYQGAEYLASVPAATSPPSAPSIASLGSPVQATVEMAGRRSISPISTHTQDSITSGLPTAHRRRILHLVKTLNGVMSGNLMFRRDEASRWFESYCYIHEETGSLKFEPKGGGEGAHDTLIPDVRGCVVTPNIEGETPYLEVTVPHTGLELHIKLLAQPDFDAWLAAFLHWQTQVPVATMANQTIVSGPPSSRNGAASRPPDPPPRVSSARQRHHISSHKSDSKSERRKSLGNSLKEAPVIKIGKMIYWDTNVSYSSMAPGHAGGPPKVTTRSQAYRMQSYGSRRWRRISSQLRENGELKLHSDADNSLISVVQLSQLSRCAIQRLDPSVLDHEFCIAIYPQYTSSPSSAQPSFLRPIFLSLESRVLYEVWFVLLRAFTIPQLYGPAEQDENGHMKSTQDLEHMLATTTTDMFRMERSLSIRIVEAKMYPPTAAMSSDTGFSGGHNSKSSLASSKSEQHGYYAEILLDNESRGKTAAKFEGLNPLWGESFEFMDLPSVLSSASVVIKRRPPESALAREQHESKLVHEAYGFTEDQHGGFTGLTFDVTCGKVEIYLQELEEHKEVEKWWPLVNMHKQRVGEVLVKARAEECVTLMARDYKPLEDLLHRLSNGLTLQIAQLVSGELKRLSDCLLDIYQVSGKAGDWIMALVEEEIDGIHKETPISRLRYSSRIGSESSHDSIGTPTGPTDRELIVRDLNKNATVEANLLFRGNTLLTKALDTHMRRVGKEYLEHSLATKIRDINDKDPDCEVDPNRVSSPQEVERNWRRLFTFTQEVWSGLVAAKSLCPVELRIIFRHIRACAEDRYGDFLRSVSYSSVSGFLFLRFFCPAVLNPKLFGLLKDDIKPRARRTFTLIAKSLQTLANMASFGIKEPWMENMNQFLQSHRESFKTLIDDVCYVPTPIPAAVRPASPAYNIGTSLPFPNGLVTAETHLAYTTPTTIMHRLPPTSREGFPSLPYLIDQARAYADLVQLWLEATSPAVSTVENAPANNTRRLSDIRHAIHSSDGDLIAFHEFCTSLHHRTQECLNRAERAERPNSALSFHWEELIDQLQTNNHATDSGDEMPIKRSFDSVAKQIASDPSVMPPTSQPNISLEAMRAKSREWDRATDEDPNVTRLYDPTPPPSGSATTFDVNVARDPERRNSAAMADSLHGSLRRALASRSSVHSHSQSASASASNVSSVVSSDTEHTTGTTALPSYEREVRSRERREAARQQMQQAEEARNKERERDKERRKPKTPLAALRKKKEKEGRTGSVGVPKGVDMSHV